MSEQKNIIGMARKYAEDMQEIESGTLAQKLSEALLIAVETLEDIAGAKTYCNARKYPKCDKHAEEALSKIRSL